MLILISGPNGSGKSTFAEGLAAQSRGRRYYIATMVPQTEENRLRIEKHRAQRQGLGFTTLELPCEVGNAPVGPDCVVLLEDVSNLLANACFERGRAWEAVFRDILALASRCGVLIAVTISGLRASDYDGETAGYIAALQSLNQALFQTADRVAELRGGKPYYQKGDWNDPV